MSNLGMSLLTLSDGLNTSEQDLMEPETPRMLNDDLLDFDNQYIPNKDYKMKKLNQIEKQFETSSHPKQGNPLAVDKLLVKGFQRKGSNETYDAREGKKEDAHVKPTRYSVQPLGMIKNNSDLGALLQAERLSESELLNVPKSSAGAVKRDLPMKLQDERSDPKKSFGDFFVSRNRAVTSDAQVIMTEALRKNHDTTSQHGRGNSVTSNNSSIDGRQRAESDFLMSRDTKTRDKDRTLKLAAMRKAGQPEVNPQFERSDLLMDKEYRSTMSRKSTQGQDRISSPLKENFISEGKAMTLKANSLPELLLTAKAKELMKTKMTHKSIPSKYHTELFKMMDSKSKTYDFSESQMGDGGIYFIAKYVKDNQEIDTLKLDNCKITDDGLSILLHAMTAIKLDKLYLRDNLITKDGVETIKRFIQMKRNVHLINLKGNPLEKGLMTANIKEFSHHKVILIV